MNQLKSFLASFPPILGALIFLGYVGFDFYRFRNADDSPLVQTRVQVDAGEKDLEAKRKRLTELKAFYKQLDLKRDEIKTLAVRLGNLKLLIPEEMNLPDLQRMILTEAAKAGLTAISWSPGTVARQEFFTQQNFSLEAKGLFFRFLVFMDRLTNAQRILRVQDIELSPINAVMPAQRFIELNAKVELIAYRYNETPADQVGTPAAPGAAVNAPALTQTFSTLARGTHR